MSDAHKISKSDEQWRNELSPAEYEILRKKGTERPFTGEYWNTFEPGDYTCRACGADLFNAATKYDAGCGWPSFSDTAHPENIESHQDTSFGMMRTEVVCKQCGSHLGHVFDDGPTPTGKRYCINSASLTFHKK